MLLQAVAMMLGKLDAAEKHVEVDAHILQTSQILLRKGLLAFFVMQGQQIEVHPYPKTLLSLFFGVNLARQKITPKNKNNLARLFFMLVLKHILTLPQKESGKRSLAKK